MSDELEVDGGSHARSAAFGDLMSVLLGAFVLILVGVVAVQLELSQRLDQEVKQRQAEAKRLQTLEQALAGPLAAGRVTLVDGRIGISGSVLFALNSDQLQPEGQELLRSLAAPLAAYLGSREEILMVSGFTDDAPVREGNRRFADNWELSAQRSLTVTRTLIADGVPADAVFAAAFGSEQPVSSNANEEGRARNRRVEIAPIPKPRSRMPSKPPALEGLRALVRDLDAGRARCRITRRCRCCSRCSASGRSCAANCRCAAPCAPKPRRRRPAELGGAGAAHAGHDAGHQPRLPAPLHRLRGHVVLAAGTAGWRRQRR